MANTKKLLQAAAGTAAAAGGGGAAGSADVTDVFSTYLYEGNGAGTVIANGVDLGGPADNVELHLQGDDNTTSADASTRSRTLTKTGTISTSTTAKKFTAALNFNNNAYFVADAPLVNDTAPFCVETWIQWDDTQASNDMSMICSQYASSASGRFLFGAQAGALVLRVNGATVYLTTSVSTSTWYHIAWTWDGTTHRLFKDGTLVDSSTTVPSLYLGTNTGIGGQATLSSYTLDGRIEDFRITQGKARYTEDFTVPSANFDVDTTSNGGGLVWVKQRSSTNSNTLHDTERGTNSALFSNNTSAENTQTNRLTSFNSNGFSLGDNGGENTSGEDYASWTFKKRSKFFDVVTYTGDGTAGRTVSHNLGSVPGCIIVKATSSAYAWEVYHRGMDSTNPENYDMRLNENTARSSNVNRWNNTAPTSTEFSLGNGSLTNGSGVSFVAYLFAHNDGDGDFGPNSDQDIIKCGSFTESSSEQEINLGFEPQWLMIKTSSTTSGWRIFDMMRGFDYGGSGTTSNANLEANTSSAEGGSSPFFKPTPTGFTVPSGFFGSGTEYIYIAIRRGPLASPTDATDVFAIDTRTTGDPNYTSNFPVDWLLYKNTTGSNSFAKTRLTGTRLKLDTTEAESGSYTSDFAFNDGAVANQSTLSTRYGWMWKRAPSFCDVVAYTGNGTAGRTVSHNLGVAPEMMWIKRRDAARQWGVYHKDIGNTKAIYLNDTGTPVTTSTFWNDTTPTESVFTVGTNNTTNASAGTYIAYLFASLDGISKVGSYTGTGSTAQTIDCGFNSGARFVLIKRSSGTSQWHVFDAERGITSTVNDGVLYLNLTNAEQPESSAFGASIDAIQPDSSGFKVQYSDINSSGETYIFYAIA